jgi:hypothetical protein
VRIDFRTGIWLLGTAVNLKLRTKTMANPHRSLPPPSNKHDIRITFIEGQAGHLAAVQKTKA